MSDRLAREGMIHRALELQRTGRFAEAEQAYLNLLKLWPRLPECWYNLGYVQRRSGRYEAALASYGRALDLKVSKPEEVHLNRAVIYSDCLRQDEAAERELKAALRLDPRYVPALLNLGNLCEDRGRRQEAGAFYERVLAIDPGHAEALSRLAGVEPPGSLDAPLLSRLKCALAQPSLPAAGKASLGFALGLALDRLGAHDEAFAAYVEANRQSRLSTGRKGSLYDRASHEKFIRKLIDASPAGAGAAGSAAGVGQGGDVRGTPTPVFICGMFRSGSTLAEQMLAAHSRLTAGGELPILPGLVATELAPFPDPIKDAPPETFQRLASRYRETLAALYPKADLVTDKRPDNFLLIGLIKRLFPSAKIVHTLRQPLDNCLSIFFLHLDHSMGYALDLLDTAHYYREYRRLMAHWKTLYPQDIFDLDYDALVRDPRPALERLLGFLGLGWEEACLDFHKRESSVKTASAWQVREPLYQRASGRWRRYEPHLLELRRALAGFLAPPAAPE